MSILNSSKHCGITALLTKTRFPKKATTIFSMKQLSIALLQLMNWIPMRKHYQSLVCISDAMNVESCSIDKRTESELSDGALRRRKL